MGLVLLGMWLSAPVASAQAPLSLEEAVQRAVQRSARLREADARVAAAESTITARQGAARPIVQASAGYVRTNHVDEFGIRQPDGTTRVIFPDIPDNVRARLESSWAVWTGGRVAAAASAATAERDAVIAERSALEADLALEVSLAYWHVVTTRASVSVLDAAVARADAWLTDVRARVDAGVSAPHEIAQAQAVRARQHVQRLQARQAVDLAERELARLIGDTTLAARVLTTPVTIPATDVAAMTEDRADALVAAAATARAERRAFGARAAAFRSAADAAMAAVRPQVGLLAAIEPSRPNARFVPRSATWHTSWDLGVSVTWMVFDGGRARSERAVALAQAEAAEARQAEFDSRLAVEVHHRVRDVATSREAASAAADAVRAAEEVVRVMHARAEAGVATSTDVLDAQVALLEASLEQTRLQAGARQAEARLRRALGGRP
jgi:outer membrane protein